MFVFCKKCGLIKNMKTDIKDCPVCEESLISVPPEYLTASGSMFLSQKAREDLENQIKTSNDYDESIASQKEAIIAQKELEAKEIIEEKISEYKNTYSQKSCPICKSTSISKISNIKKVVKVGALGLLGSGDLGKTWKCDTCNSKF